MQNHFRNSLLILILTIHSTATWALPTCEPEISYRTTHQDELINGTALGVTKITTENETSRGSSAGVSIQALFGESPQLIIGVDESHGSMPYLVIGHSMIEVKSQRTETHTINMYNVALEAGLPTLVTNTLYKVGTGPAATLPKGYFVRITGLPEDLLLKMESKALRNPAFTSENESKEIMMANILGGLSKADVRLDCKEPSCRSLNEFLNKSTASGFTYGDQKLTAHFHIVDQESLAMALALGRDGNLGQRIFMRSMYASLGLMGAATSIVVYDLAARAWGWPLIRILGFP